MKNDYKKAQGTIRFKIFYMLHKAIERAFLAYGRGHSILNIIRGKHRKRS